MRSCIASAERGDDRLAGFDRDVAGAVGLVAGALDDDVHLRQEIDRALDFALEGRLAVAPRCNRTLRPSTTRRTSWA